MRSWLPVLIAAVLCGQVSAQIVQNYDLRAITRTDGVIPVGDGSKFVGEGGATARASLGLAIGTNVQAYDADLTTWAGVSPSANGQSLVSAANYAAMRGLLDLEVGTDLQAYDAELTAIAGLAVTDGNIIVGNGTTWVAESGATARTSLGLGTIATQAAGSVAITGGTIDGATIGGTTAAAGAFTGLTLGADNAQLALGAAGPFDSYLAYSGTALDVYAVGGLSLRQAADAVGFHVFGYDDMAASNLHVHVDSAGASWLASSGAMRVISSGNVILRAAAASPLFLDSGGEFTWRDTDGSFATRATLDSATGAFDTEGSIMFKPGSSVTPANNGDVTFELTNNTTLTVKAKGSDGTVRTVALTLAP